ncbi:MAG TPA: carboxypeptidase-like regulatory domain-containing protein [Pirellulales bacterium]|nr:carboxypeptidase-like regulatory domain-containing protein [Pirellulales bacterium]
MQRAPLCVLSVVAVLVAAYSNGVFAAEPGPDPNKLIGRLVDAQGQPIAGAQVSQHEITCRPIPAALPIITDSAGNFELPSTPGAPLHVAELAALAVVTAAGNYFEVNTPVMPEAAGRIDIPIPTLLTAQAKAPDKVGIGELAGVVVDQDGNPLADVEVHPWDWYPRYRTKTNKDGVFRVPLLGRGAKVEVRFKKEGFSPETFIHAPTGTPGWVVALGKETSISGTVRDADGKPAAGALIRANQGPKSADGVMITTIWTETKSDDQGRYQLFLQPDVYELLIRTPEQGVLHQTNVVVARGSAERDLELAAGVAFRAVVVDAQTEEPVAGVRLWNRQHKDVEGRSNADGLVIIPGMLPGTFEFSIDAPSYRRWWSEEAKSPWNRRSVAKPELKWQRNFDYLDFDLRPGMPTAKIFVEKGVRIRGRVVDPDGRPVAGATAAPALTGSGNSLTGDTRFSVPTKADGSFEMLLPASNDAQYNLVAHDGKYEEWRKWANGVLPPITTVPGQEIDDVEIRLTRGATVRGQVVDAKGKPVPFCEVRAHAADLLENRYYDPTVKTGANGKFELMFIRPGKQFIQCAPLFLLARDAPAKSSVELKLAEGQSVDDVELVTGGPPAQLQLK